MINRLAFPGQPSQIAAFRNLRLDHCKRRMPSNRLQILQPPRRTVIDYGDRFAFTEQSLDQMGANEPGSACDQDVFGAICHRPILQQSRPDSRRKSLFETLQIVVML